MAYFARFSRIAAMIATKPEAIVMNNAGATMPVMSSPFPRDRIISATIPATIKALMATAEYLTDFNVDGDCISDFSQQRRIEDHDQHPPCAANREIIRLSS